jgi:hypothetical protein
MQALAFAALSIAASPTRRDVVGCSVLCALASSSPLQRPERALALDVETVRRAAANIPSYGEPDIYYPQAFRSRWTARRRVYDVHASGPLKSPGLDAVFEEASRLAEQGDEGVRYDVRFIERDGEIIADRAFNAEALALAVHGVTREAQFDRPTAEWSPSNPNVLTLREGSRLVEYKVTRRSTEQPAPFAFGSSEYERVADAGSDGVFGSVPLIQARRIETRYRWAPAGTASISASGGSGTAANVDSVRVELIESTERVSWFDPMQTGFADLKGAAPALVVKSRIDYSRVRT